MLPTARRLVASFPHLETPSQGTGPQGAGGGKRWITIDDVILHNYAKVKSVPPHSLSCIPFSLSLRDYQEKAVSSATSSGVIEVGCGLGKTFIGGDIIRRFGWKAVVVCQHSMGVEQWVSHFQDMGMTNVATCHTTMHPDMIFPDVVVVTYQSVCRNAAAMQSHMTTGTQTEGRSLLLYMLHVFPIGCLILDEVHIAVADIFRLACCINHKLVFGLSGSLIREDDRLDRLFRYVGPVLYRYFVDRKICYRICRVAMCEETKTLVSNTKSGSSLRRCLLACHPNKIAALRMILKEGENCIVFCESPKACKYIHQMFPGSLLMTGFENEEEKNEAIQTFNDSEGQGILFCTKVCDSGINIKNGTTVVQLFSASGSRQQEMQRVGRGARDCHSSCSMVYIVNMETKEGEYMEKRIAFVRSQTQNTVEVVRDRVFPVQFADEDKIAFRKFLEMKIKL